MKGEKRLLSNLLLGKDIPWNMCPMAKSVPLPSYTHLAPAASCHMQTRHSTQEAWKRALPPAVSKQRTCPMASSKKNPKKPKNNHQQNSTAFYLKSQPSTARGPPGDAAECWSIVHVLSVLKHGIIYDNCSTNLSTEVNL